MPSRLINGESIISPRSHCTSCQKTLKWYELIPVVSYVIQKGQCNNCGSKIGKDSLISEVILGLLFVISFMVYGFSYNTLIAMVLSCFFLSISLSDFKNLIILDSTIVTAIILLTILIFLNAGIRGIYKSFLYGVFGFVLMFIVKILGDYYFKRESLGGGDIKLSFITGMVLPYNLFLASLIISCMTALPYATIGASRIKNGEIPFGPFLSFGLLVTFLLEKYIQMVLKLLVV